MVPHKSNDAISIYKTDGWLKLIWKKKIISC